jgi:hypothetical protein
VPEPENPADPAAVAVMVGVQGGKGLYRRKLLERFEKLEASYVGLLMFACAFIAFRKAGVI